ncbi:MAG: 2OG-Fe(II) oxygenase [Nitriliruptorales bacterium]|nr:2OG-Fe(II) oxygenase [Nitriliruptorales bacterium]
MATRPLISRGERAPDFVLPRVDSDERARFYGFVGGRPAVLILAGGVDVAPLAAELTDSPDSRDLDVHVVTRAPADGIDGAFHDPEGGVHEAYGAVEAAPVAVVLDPNVRAVATVAVSSSDVSATAESIRAAIPHASQDQPHVAPRLAPVLFVPDAISAPVREQLIERWHTEGAVETGVETVVDGERAEATDIRRKRRRDHVVEDRQLLRELTQHIGARVFPELAKAFAFQAGGFEGFKIGCYTADDRGHFEAHRDNLSSGTAHRRFGISINLNGDYDGGELRFPEYGATRYRPVAGEALVFSGSHLHEVLPVERGQRFVLLSFILARR